MALHVSAHEKLPCMPWPCHDGGFRRDGTAVQPDREERQRSGNAAERIGHEYTASVILVGQRLDNPGHERLS